MREIKEKIITAMQQRVSDAEQNEKAQKEHLQSSYADHLINATEAVKDQYNKACEKKEKEQEIKIRVQYRAVVNKKLTRSNMNEILEELQDIQKFYTKAKYCTEQEYMELSEKISECEKEIKKKRRRPFVLLTMIAIFAAVIVIGIKGAREVGYREAKKKLEEGDIVEAVEIMEKIKGYRDVDELLNEGEAANVSKYYEGKKYFMDGKYLEAMDLLVDIPYFEDSQNYLTDSAKSYLHGLWSDDRETYTRRGFGFNETDFYQWRLESKGLSYNVKYVYDYPMEGYYVFRDNEELHIAINCYDDGELGSLEFSNLDNDSFYCIEEDANFSRYELD